MSCARDARKLAEYVSKIPEANITHTTANQFSYFHVGALFTDVVLQSGLNYRTVVKPRVQRIILQYPDYDTTRKFVQLASKEGLCNLISWNHEVKLGRLTRLIDFALSNDLDTCSDLKAFLCKRFSCDQFLSLNGFGPKSLDYLLKLLNVDTVAVDRHIYSFVKLANVDVKGYHETKRIVEFAADFLNMSRSALDQVIWTYMSQKQNLAIQSGSQYPIEFTDL